MAILYCFSYLITSVNWTPLNPPFAWGVQISEDALYRLDIIACCCRGLLGLADWWAAGLQCWSGLLVCWSVGLLVIWSAGLLVCWSAGLLVCWSVGLLVCWSAGLLVCWFVGLLVCCLAGLLVCSNFDVTILYYNIQLYTSHYITHYSIYI